MPDDFGELAIRLGVISADQLAQARERCEKDPRLGLADALVSLGAMTPAGRMALEVMAKVSDQPFPGNAWNVSSSAASGDTLDYDSDDPNEGKQDVEPGPRADGRFERRRLHATGGLGKVYEAFDRQLNRLVALKEIKDLLADNPESRERFVQEAEITGRLEHPGIVPVYALGSYPDGRPYYAMRFVKGSSLRTAIEKYHAGEPAERQVRASPCGHSLTKWSTYAKPFTTHIVAVLSIET